MYWLMGSINQWEREKRKACVWQCPMNMPVRVESLAKISPANGGEFLPLTFHTKSHTKLTRRSIHQKTLRALRFKQVHTTHRLRKRKISLRAGFEPARAEHICSLAIF